MLRVHLDKDKVALLWVQRIVLRCGELQHLYYNVPNGWQQLLLSNVHYHANVKYPKVQVTNFVLSAVLVLDDLKPKLLEAHKVFVR